MSPESHDPFLLLWFEISVDDADEVEMVQGQGQLREVELDVLLCEHDLLGEPGEEVPTSKELQHQVEFALSLKGCDTEG